MITMITLAILHFFTILEAIFDWSDDGMKGWLNAKYTTAFTSPRWQVLLDAAITVAIIWNIWG